MKRFGGLILLVIIMVESASAQAGALLLSSDDVQQLENQLSFKSDKEEKYFIYINPRDCGNCINSSYFLNSLPVHDSSIFIFLEAIKESKRKAFCKEFNLKATFNYPRNFSGRSLITAFFAPSEIPKSWIARLKGHVLSILPLHQFQNAGSFEIDILKVAKKIELKSNEKYFSGFFNLSPFKGHYLGLCYPKSELLYFDKNGQYTNQFELDSISLKLAYQYLDKGQDDSIQKLNSFRQSVNVFNKMMKPMGFKYLSNHKLIKHNQKVYVISLIAIPYKDSPSNFEVSGQYFLIELELVESQLIAKSIKPIEHPDDINATIFASNFASLDGSRLKVGLAPKSKDSIKRNILPQLHYEYELNNWGYRISHPSHYNLNHKTFVKHYNSHHNLTYIHSLILNDSSQHSFFEYVPLILDENSEDIKLVDSSFEEYWDHYRAFVSWKSGDIYYIIYRSNSLYFLSSFSLQSNSIIKTVELNFSNFQMQTASIENGQLFGVISNDKDDYKFFEMEIKKLENRLTNHR